MIEAADIADLLDRLVAKSLVRYDTNQQRFHILETIKQFSLSELAAEGSQQVDKYRRRHAEHWLATLRDTSPSNRAKIVLIEFDNLQAAADWSLSAGEIDAELELVERTHIHWYTRGYVRDGHRRASDVLARAKHHRSIGTSRVSWCVGDFAMHLGRVEEARTRFRYCLEIAKEFDDPLLQSRALGSLAMTYSYVAHPSNEDYAQARSLYEESIKLLEGAPENFVLATTLSNVAGLIISHDHRHTDQIRSAEALREAKEMLLRSKQLCEASSNSYALPDVLYSLAILSSDLGEIRAASRYLVQTLDTGEPVHSALALKALAHVAMKKDAITCVRIGGWAISFLDNQGFVPTNDEQRRWEATAAQLRSTLGEQYDETYARSSKLTAEEAIWLARDLAEQMR